MRGFMGTRAVPAIGAGIRPVEHVPPPHTLLALYVTKEVKVMGLSDYLCMTQYYMLVLCMKN